MGINMLNHRGGEKERERERERERDGDRGNNDIVENG